MCLDQQATKLLIKHRASRQKDERIGETRNMEGINVVYYVYFIIANENLGLYTGMDCESF